MYRGPNDTDWQVAKFQHRELVATGQHQQMVASVLATKSHARPVSPAARRYLAALLVRVGQRLTSAAQPCPSIAPRAHSS